MTFWGKTTSDARSSPEEKTMKAEDDVDVVSVTADYDDKDDNDAESDNDDDTHDEMN